MLKIVALTPADFNRWADHMNRQIAESGRNGRPFFSPMQAVEFASIERRARFGNGLAKPVFEPMWSRMWAIESPDACLIAHVDLSGSNIPTEQHRATLGIGVEAIFHRQGYGRKLMLQAIEFSRHNRIEYLDLSVFSENKAAVCLYLSLGFEEVGRRNDRFRIFGRSVDDVTMTLRIKG